MRNKGDLLAALKKELVLRKNEVDESVDTVYFGGGTPSLLSKKEMLGIFESIHANYIISKNVEITLEANPDDLSKSYLQDLHSLGFNRLSIGVQSFFDDDLKFMNRAHTSKEATNCVINAKDIGFENITIDLIYGIPGLTSEKWQQNLETFLSLNIPHLSSYALTVEPKTALAYFIKSKKIKALDDDLAQEHFEILRSFMKEYNYLHYEVSNFAKEGFLSQHNSAYWQGKVYLGIGPSAHSYDQSTRSWNVASNVKYIKQLQEGESVFEQEVLSGKDRYNEYLMTRLRTMWGINIETIETEFGKEVLDYFLNKSAVYLKKNQLYRINDIEIGVRPEFFFLIDGIISELFML